MFELIKKSKQVVPPLSLAANVWDSSTPSEVKLSEILMIKVPLLSSSLSQQHSSLSLQRRAFKIALTVSFW